MGLTLPDGLSWLLHAFALGALARLLWPRRRAVPPSPAPPAESERPLTPQEVAALRAATPCMWCGGYHHGLCGRVTRVWYYPNGAVKQAILQDEWSTERTIWPESLPDEV